MNFRYVGHVCSRVKVGSVLRQVLYLCNSAGHVHQTQPTAAIIIIGDEIIKGQVKDSNSHYLCRRLYQLGVRVEKVSVVRDDVVAIAAEVRCFAPDFTYVLTSGGIGPTHDDVTFAAIAEAFGEPLIINRKLAALVKLFFGRHITDESPEMRLAQIPKSSKLNFSSDQNDQSIYPLTSVRNVFIFPGIPHLLEKQFELIGKRLFCNALTNFHTKNLYLTVTEVKISPALNRAVEKFRKIVTFGSYPDYLHSYYRVRISMEAEQKEMLAEAEHFLKDQLPEGVFMSFDEEPVQTAFSRVKALTEHASGAEIFAQRVQHSVQLIDECLGKYNLSDVLVCFNGGKDCTALLHLVHAVVQKRGLTTDSKYRLTALYVREEEPFPQVEMFVNQTAVRYGLNLITVDGPIKTALEHVKNKHPNLYVTFLGTRKTDPHSVNLEPFQETDDDWPRFLRAHPMLDWSYSDVWSFIRQMQLPYCSLYDQGYTSLGGRETTFPNPHLHYVDRLGRSQYKAAHLLDDDSLERQSRH